jgi:hypothetical protein
MIKSNLISRQIVERLSNGIFIVEVTLSDDSTQYNLYVETLRGKTIIINCDSFSHAEEVGLALENVTFEIE